MQNGNKVIHVSGLNPKHEIRNSKQSQMLKFQMSQTKEFRKLDFENLNLFRISIFGFRIFESQTLFGSGYASLGS